MKSNESDRFTFVRVFTTHLICGVLSIFLALALMLLISILVSKEILPADILGNLGTLVVFLASLLPCFFLTRKYGRTFLTSLIQGAFNFSMYYIMGLLVFMRIVPGNMKLSYLIACMVGAVIGGVLSAVVAPQRRRIKTK